MRPQSWAPSHLLREALGARHISDSLPGEAESVATKHGALAHRGRVSALLDGAIHDPNRIS
jgi:hypothetical protein